MDLPDQALFTELQAFGRVQGISDECVPGFTSTGTGNQRVRMEMTRPVPNLLRVGEWVEQCEYEGVIRMCRRFNLEGHQAAACNTPMCARCEKFGHGARGDHAVLTCAVRIYMLVAVRPEQQKLGARARGCFVGREPSSYGALAPLSDVRTGVWREGSRGSLCHPRGKGGAPQ